jgi:hypothetical protein
MLPRNEVDAPRDMKITEKPSTNRTEFAIVISLTLFELCAEARSSNDIPEIKDTYDGTRGSTQGERNEMTPAKKARGRLISSTI